MHIFSYIGKFVMSLAVILAAGMGGCDVLHDDLSECDLYLRFRYDYNLASEDWFADQVGARSRSFCSVPKVNISGHSRKAAPH